MIRRKPRRKKGDKRRRELFAWWPQTYDYNDEHVWMWLTRYVVDEECIDTLPASDPRVRLRWKTVRKLSLSDALLEKLNPPPAPQPAPASTPNVSSNLSSYAGLLQQYPQYQQQIAAYTQAKYQAQLAGLLGGGSP